MKILQLFGVVDMVGQNDADPTGPAMVKIDRGIKAPTITITGLTNDEARALGRFFLSPVTVSMEGAE